MQIILTITTKKTSLFTRMFLSLFLHLSILGSAQESMNRMKFTVNHSYMFNTPDLASFVCILQFMVTFLID